jgi:hypothetical protein
LEVGDLPISEATQNLIATLIAIVIIVYAITRILNINLGELMLGLRATRRARVDDEPRDQAERWLSNHRKVAKDCKPPPLTWLWLTGDDDVPPIKVGRIKGLEAHQEGYLTYVKTSRLSWSKPYILIRELCSDANRVNLFVSARGFSTNGLYRWAIGPTKFVKSPIETVDRAHNLFQTLFTLQMLTDAEEDSAWATATAIMPSMDQRVAKAEAEVPHLGERPYVPEREVVGR